MIANPVRICNHTCMFDRPTWRDRIEDAWTRRSLVWLVGVRRVGKTVLCRSLDDVEYLDCELPSVRRALEDPESFLRSVGGKRVVLDEVHRLPDPSELLKIAADHFPDVRVVATGSSTLQATAKFRDSLAGRKEEVWLTPMIEADRASAGGTLTDRLGLGGLPSFFLGESTEREAQEWLDAYWAKDVQELFRLERRASFMRFVELVLARSGGIFEATAFAGPAEVSRPTIANYLSALEMTKVAHVIRPFSTRRSTEIVHAPKVYGFDTGFVKTFRGWGELRTEDLGLLWEHYVLNELQGRPLSGEIRHWRSTRHHEVDFVFVRRGRPPTAIECKWRADGREELSGLKAFRRAYPHGPSFVVASGRGARFRPRAVARREGALPGPRGTGQIPGVKASPQSVDLGRDLLQTLDRDREELIQRETDALFHVGDLVAVHPRRERSLLELLLHARDLHAGRPLGTNERRGHQQPGDRVGVDDRPRHQVGAVLLVGVGEDAVHDAVVDARLAEPLGGEPGVLRAVVAGVVLIEVVEQTGEAPQVLVLGEPARERAHHAFDRDQVPVGRLLQAPLVRERVGRLAIHVRVG